MDALQRSKGARRERVIASPQWSEGVFRNLVDVTAGLKKGTAGHTIGEYFCGKQARTPPGTLPMLDPRASWAARVETGLRTTWLGHSTVLLEVDGARILTDPVFGLRASPTSFAGPKRFHPVPVALEAVLPVDAVLLTHDHYDHLCAPTMRALALTDTRVVTSLGVGAHLEGLGISHERITELDWWEGTDVAGLRISAAPAQHFSGRGFGDRNRTLWGSYVLQGPRHKVFFSGDTGLHGELPGIRDRLGPFDLVMLEIGAWNEAWGDIHLGPAGALEAFARLGGGTLLPVHWGTFNLALHAWDEPAVVLVERAAQRGLRVVTPRLGAAVEPMRVDRVDPWWLEVAAPAPALRGP